LDARGTYPSNTRRATGISAAAPTIETSSTHDRAPARALKRRMTTLVRHDQFGVQE